MGLFSGIRDAIGIRKDLAELKKTKKEVEKLVREEQQSEYLIHRATPDEIENYDPKTKKLVSEIKRK